MHEPGASSTPMPGIPSVTSISNGEKQICTLERPWTITSNTSRRNTGVAESEDGPVAIKDKPQSTQEAHTKARPGTPTDLKPEVTRDISAALQGLLADVFALYMKTRNFHIGRERGEGIVDLVKQAADLRAVIDVVGGQRRRDDLAATGVHTDVQFAPRLAPGRAVLLDQPLAGAAEL